MSDTSTVFVTVHDAEGNPVTGARLELRPREGGGAASPLRYDDARGEYVSQPVPPGRYLVAAEAAGYERQEARLELKGPELHTSVVLGRTGQPFYVARGRRVYFEPDGDRVAALVREPAEEPEPEPGNARPEAAGRGRPPAASPGLARLRALQEATAPGVPVRRGVVVFDRKPLAAARGGPAAEPGRLLREMPEVIDAGPRLRTPRRDQVVFLSRQVEVHTEPGITPERLAAAVAPLGLRIAYQDGHDSTYYLLEADDLPEPSFGTLPERLEALPEIRDAASIVRALEEDTFIPGDAAFSLQFHSYVTRVTDAWDLVSAAADATRFGSADVVVAVHDSGILTTGTGTVISHPDLAGTVTGGTLSARPGLTANRVLFTHDFAFSPMRAGNDFPTASHGSWVAGTISAQSGGGTGVVGVAANTRLASYIRPGTAAQWDNIFDFMAGMDPRWRRAGPYTATEPFPALLGTGQNPVPGADIINCSHTHFGMVAVALANTLQRITLFGRQRRGTLVFAAAGNNDQDCRIDGTWAENTNVIRVSASSLDLRDEEVRMNYSSFALPADRIVDFAAPSESQNFSPTVHQAPGMLGFITTDQGVGTGDLRGTAAFRTPLVAPLPAVGGLSVRIGAGLQVNFAAGQQVILRDTANPAHSSLHTVAGTAAGTVNLNEPVGYAYTLGNVEIIGLGGTRDYTVQFGGTSAAAPQAVGIAALLLSVNPRLTWLEVRELMRRTAVPINLRYRGWSFPAPVGFRYRWRYLPPPPPVGPPAPPVDLLDPHGQLVIAGGNRTITAGPVSRGTRMLTLNDTAGITPRQALLIGAEAKLNGAHPLPAPNQAVINVDRPDDFEAGDLVFIGKDTQTVVIDPTAAGATTVWVQSLDGFAVGDDITIGAGATAETVRVTGSARSPGGPATFGPADTGLVITRLNGAGAPIAGGLANPHARADLVRTATTQREGPFIVRAKGAGSLTLDVPVVRNHPHDRVVRKDGTEVKAVIHVIHPNFVEVDPLDFDHPFNVNGVEHVRVGHPASYSLAFGFGRLDAREAVLAAHGYDHSERDLVVRSFAGDDGVNDRAAQPVESPDVWSRNDAATTLATLPNYADPGPHQPPEVTVDPAVFVGVGRNDLEVSGACTSAAEVALTLEIDGTGATDTFSWSRDGAAPTTGVAITGAAQALAAGVSVRFAATTGHTLGDRWIVRARLVANRFLHVRVFNRGTLPYFNVSAFAPAASPAILDVARSRILLAVSDGFPVCRFTSVAAAPGSNDLEVVASYTGANPRALYTVEITAAAPGGDTFRWFRDGVVGGGPTVLTAATLTQTLSDGVQVRFGSHTGHAVGDRWDLYARSGADAFLNLDHYWEYDEATAFNPAPGGMAGTRVLAEPALAGLAPATARIDSVAWPEALRLPTNSPNRPKPARPLRMLALGEVVPHDGPGDGFTPSTNNNFSYRELVFAKLRFTRDNGLNALETSVDVDNLGLPLTRSFRVEVRTMAGTFAAERVRVRLAAKRAGGVEETRTFRWSAGGWVWEEGTPAWAALNAPLEARRPDGSQPPATGEQFDVQFDGTFTVDRSFTELVITAEILSDFRDVAVASARHTVTVYEMAPMPTGVGMAAAAALPRPRSHVFADPAGLTQTAGQAFGPVADAADPDSRTTRFRATSLFRATTDVSAYAVTDGFVAVQRDPASADTVNLVLRPFRQPVAGFTPVRYFVYRGLRLTDFLHGPAAADEVKVRARAGAPAFIDQTWTTFLALNPGATEMPSSVLGYDPATQAAGNRLDDLFFGGPTQLPFVAKGTVLGRFHHAAGAYDFGFEIVAEEGDYAPDLAYARRASYEVDVSAMPSGTPAEQFALRVKREEALNFLDPAAFYGLHMHDGGQVERPGGPAWTGQDVYASVVDRFHTRNLLYVDVRSENGSSLNFQRNYDDGSGNHVQVGPSAAALAARPYATDEWPVLIVDRSAPAATAAGFHELHLQLPVDDNEDPALYVEHGTLLSAATNGPFVRDAELLPATPGQWTRTQGFRFPNTGAAGARKGVAWVLRMHYGRQRVAAPTVPLPNTVLRTARYTDNVWGPIDRASRWAGTAALRWISTQDNRYVDAAAEQGWRQMMKCGLATQAGGALRVLLYAVTTASDTNAAYDFVPVRGVADGVSDRASFFAEPALFAGYLLEHDQVNDGGTAVRTLRLRQGPADGLPPTSALLLGLAKTEFDTLQALSGAGISASYLRTLVLDAKTSSVDPSGRPFDRWRVGIQGLRTADGHFVQEFPAPDIHVYSVDGQLFASADFAGTEPLPAAYARSYEEEKGARMRPARERRIGAANAGAHTLTIQGWDGRREVVPGDRVRIAKSAANNGEYTVSAVALAGTDTVITLAAGPPGAAAPLGSLFTVPKAVEDWGIDLDQAPSLSGVDRMRLLVNGFLAGVAAVPNDGGAQAALQAAVDQWARLVYRRAQLCAAAGPARADDMDRALYWARIRMLVALKGHPWSLASLAGRNALVASFEAQSRGYGSTFFAAPGGARKILILATDAYDLAADLEASSPAAAVALALHGRTITAAGKQAYVESAILPLRYRDFDAGQVEALVNPHLDGVRRVDVILSLSLNPGAGHFDVERFAGRLRGGNPDNEFVRQPDRQLGADATHQAFYETTLPPAPLVPGPFATPPSAGQRVFFDESYGAAGLPSSHAHPAAGGANGNAPSFPAPAGTAVEGSAGDFLFNELFYRVAQRRQALASTTLAGHVSVPTPAAAQLGMDQVVAQVQEMIERWLASLP